MITASELRIGNWVMYNDQNETPMPTAIQICIQDLILINENVKDCNYKPIPLTEEILLKCGFQKRESSACNEYYIGINQVTKDWLFSITWLIKPESINAPNCPFYRNGGHNIYYLHELQNLFYSLTKTELIINL